MVCEHQLEFKHEFDWENTKIVDYVSGYQKRLTSEMIHIKFNKFSINKKEDIFTLNRIYTVRNFCIKLPLHVMEVFFNNVY